MFCRSVFFRTIATGMLMLDLMASRVTVPVGESVVLDWRSKQADKCEASGDWKGPKMRTGSESVTLTQQRTHEFVLTCTAGDRTVSRRVIVEGVPVPPKPVTMSGDEKEVDELFKRLLEFDQV